MEGRPEVMKSHSPELAGFRSTTEVSPEPLYVPGPALDAAQVRHIWSSQQPSGVGAAVVLVDRWETEAQSYEPAQGHLAKKWKSWDSSLADQLPGPSYPEGEGRWKWPGVHTRPQDGGKGPEPGSAALCAWRTLTRPTPG